MSAKDKDDLLPRSPSHSGVQELKPEGMTLGLRLLHVSRKAEADMDAADILELYFDLFEEIDPDAFWAIHLLNEHEVALQRATARMDMPESSLLRITKRAWAEAGLSDDDHHPAVELVDLYPAQEREGFQAALVAGSSVLGIISCEPSADGNRESRRNDVQIIAGTLAPRIAQASATPTPTPVGDYLSALIRRATIPLLLLDGSNHVVIASEAFRRLIGRRNLNAQPWSQFVAPRDWERVDQATRAGTPVECDLLGAASTLRVGLEFVPLAHPALRGAGALVIGRDLRTLRNLERQVIQAEKLATLGQLAAGVVHELNNPLTSILAYAEHLHTIAASSERPPKEVAALARIVESSERMRRFTQSLVAYARPAGGSSTRVDVASLIDESLGFCEHLIRDIHAHVHVDMPAELVGVRGVRASLQQVFINLITNACHATGQDGHLRIIVAVDGDAVGVRVLDDGPGVPPTLRTEIFEPFFSTKGEGDGTGLGLSIVRNILRLQSGSIELDDTYEDGACFVVRLPIWSSDRTG